MNPKSKVIVSIVAVFLVAAIIYLLKARGPHISKNTSGLNGTKSVDINENAPNSMLAKVGSKAIFEDELIWEIDLHTSVPKVQLDPISPSGHSKPEVEDLDKLDKSSPLLRQRLLVTIIERNLLYQWIQNHSEGFNFNDPGNFTECIAEQQDLLKNIPELATTARSRELLKTKLCQEALIEKYLTEKILPANAPDDAALRAYYNKNLSEFKEPQRVIFNQILLATETSAAKLKQQVSKSNFKELAKSHSISPEAADGGRLGPFRRDQLPAFFDIVFNMQIDEISGIIRSDYGYHILMLVQKLPPETLPFNAVKERIKGRLTGYSKQEAYQAWLTKAMNAIKVESSIEGTINYEN